MGGDSKAEQIAATAMQAVLQRSKARPMINESEVVINTKGTNEVIKGTQRPAFVWVEGPAMVKMNVTADRRLAKVHPDPDTKVNKVNKVRAAVKKGTKIVFIYVADDEDNDALDVTRYSKYAAINLVELLAPLKLTVDSGYEESFALEFSQEGDAVYPALKFDMEKRLERKVTAKSKAKAKKAAKSKEKAKGEAPAPEPKAPVDEAQPQQKEESTGQ